jgi:hydrogenase maturation protease
MDRTPSRCLILACGNTLRSDDGVGPHIAEWAAKHFRTEPAVRVLSRQQWTPELAEDIAAAKSVLFIDCSAESAAGRVKLVPVEPANEPPGLAMHHIGAAQLLALARDLYSSLPRSAWMLTVGAGSMELGEEFSAPVHAALPEAFQLLEETVKHLIANPTLSNSADPA